MVVGDLHGTAIHRREMSIVEDWSCMIVTLVAMEVETTKYIWREFCRHLSTIYNLRDRKLSATILLC